MLLRQLLKSDIYNEPFIFKQIGHDGSEIVWPDLKEPLCRRGFHVQELVDVALKFGVALVEIEGDPATIAGERAIIDCQIFPNPHDRMEDYMNRYHGLLLGDRLNGRSQHMVAWNHLEQHAYDPDDGECRFEELGLAIRSFYAGILVH